jgi:hypothetical protein
MSVLGIKRIRSMMTLGFVGSTIGCSRNPNIEVLGSYFPGWMLSLVFGVALTFAAHALLRKKSLNYLIGHPAVVYPCMVVLFTCLLWLSLFA